MEKGPYQEEITLMEAVDNLSSMAEIDQMSPEEVKEEGIETRHVIKWIKPDKANQSQNDVRQTFRVLHSYLKHLYEEDRSRLRDPETRKGIQAIMVLAGEAAQKVDRFSSLFQTAERKESVTELEEYQELQKFYLTKVVKRFQETLAEEEAWQEEWGQEEEKVVFDIERRGIKDLETVRKDHEYELFYLKKEDGRPFFNKNLIRHIRLVGDFDEAVSEVEEGDPIIKIKGVLEKDCLTSAQEILRQAQPHIATFYKEAFKYKERPLVAILNKAMMALMLAANPKNSMDEGALKTIVSYYTDFHQFLRQVLSLEDYQHFLANPPSHEGPLLHGLINLSHALCCSFFLRQGSRSECIELIHKLVRSQSVQETQHTSFWNTLLDQDEHMRYLLKKYPNGPVLKTLDVLHDKQQETGFDPIAQENYPRSLYSFMKEDKHITCLHLPCPIHQESIVKADIVNEFKGFLRFLHKGAENQRLLIINLQDRTSWQDHARCTAIESFQKEGEFAHNLFVVTLPKNTEFYLQSGSYLKSDDAEEFIKQFSLQIESGEECGFYFCHGIPKQEIKDFVATTLEKIHTHFFDKKPLLTRKNRLDFIEIFYQLFILRLLEWLKPDSISFSCKDALDTGAAAATGFYLFLREIAFETQWTQEEKDYVLWLLYAPALLVRERAIDPSRLHRIISALSLIEAELQVNKKEILSSFNHIVNEVKIIKEEA